MTVSNPNLSCWFLFLYIRTDYSYWDFNFKKSIKIFRILNCVISISFWNGVGALKLAQKVRNLSFPSRATRVGGVNVLSWKDLIWQDTLFKTMMIRKRLSRICVTGMTGNFKTEREVMCNEEKQTLLLSYAPRAIIMRTLPPFQQIIYYIKHTLTRWEVS